ncbi:MAG: ParB/RepB/Spo0J family partition protein [Bacteroides sp.]|nr:ParB/RepB/Spo0J family partition protein [Bacillota bacterium]MCM1393730.1 ParB/RepB/Spo0J family partition protein [[Eubacterium] siraeum]MCM1455248.1 ParB/RepB/Spo0J family partition protein [Bacteroides sp.]
MANNKGGLGQRGMSALFRDNTENVKVDIEGDLSTQEIDIHLIDRNPNQPRKTFDEESLQSMATSISMYGVLQPILLVKSENGRYLIIAGERRFRASLIAGLKTVPAIVKELSPQQIQEISLIENLHRENLNAIEAAEGIRELMENHGLTQEEVAVRIGKSRPYVTNTLRLLQLPEEVMDMVKTGKLSPGHARTILTVDNKDKLIEFAKLACDEDISVRDLERIVQNYFSDSAQQTATKRKAKEPLPLELKSFVNDMKRLFSTKVNLVRNGSKGRITIDYFSNDDLERIHAIMQLLQIYNNQNKNTPK